MLARAFRQTCASHRIAKRPSPPLSRATSSLSSSRSENHQTLDADSKRKLISLYHQCNNFISPEDLSAHIDMEFARSTPPSRLEDSLGYLKEDLYNRQRLPKMTTVNSSERDGRTAHSHRTLGWSDEQSDYSMAVKAALYGVDGSLKAGLETVEEYRRTLPPRTSPNSSSQKRS